MIYSFRLRDITSIIIVALSIRVILILIGHYLDVYLMIMPGTVGTHWHIGIQEIGTFIGFIGLFTYVVLTSLSKVPLIQKNHPLILESKHHHI